MSYKKTDGIGNCYGEDARKRLGWSAHVTRSAENSEAKPSLNMTQEDRSPEDGFRLQVANRNQTSGTCTITDQLLLLYAMKKKKMKVGLFTTNLRIIILLELSTSYHIYCSFVSRDFLHVIVPPRPAPCYSQIR